MSYVVLARKWRPRQFDDVVGQGHVARTLKNAIDQDRVAHAFLFAGARGVGKTSTARILAAALNCENGPTTTPCGECTACVEIKESRSIDVFEIDGASNRGINEIRELRESVRYAPSRDTHKIYIIDEVHMLTTEAFNALLKTLEEPPPHAKFIFATTEPQKIPVTILSRCQRYDFKRVGQTDIVDHLARLCSEEGIDAERPALQVIARQASGGMRDAVSLLDQVISFAGTTITEQQVIEILGVANRRHLFDISEAVIAGDAGKALTVLDEVHRYGYDLSQFAAELVSHFRDLTVVKVVEEPESVTDLTETELGIVRAQVERAEVDLLHRYFAVMADATQELSRTAFPKLILEMTLVRLSTLEPLVGIDVLVEQLRQLETEIEAGPGGPPQNPSQRQSAPQTKAPTPSREPSRPPVRAAEAPAARSPAPEPEPGAASAVVEPDGPQALSGSPPQWADEPPHPANEPPHPANEPPHPADERAAAPAPVSRTPAKPTVSDANELDSPQGRWKRVVDYLALEQRPLAMTCEHAFVERFEDGLVELAVAGQYLDLLQENNRLDLVEEAVRHLFGSGWQIRLLGGGGAPDGETLADARDAEVERRRKLIEDELRNSEVVQRAQDLFDVDPEQIRVQVELFDEK